MARLSLFVAACFVLVAAFVVGSSAAPSAAGSKTFINYLNGGLSFCSQCGSPGKYACSNNVGNWTNGFEFVDPIPRGSIVSRVDVTLLGSYACDVTPSVVEVDINGMPVDILESGGSNACQCGSCDGTWKFSSVYAPFNLPYYSYGDLNGISVTDMAGSICLNSVNITIYWDAPQYPGTLGASMRWNMNRYRDVQVCNRMGYDTTTPQTLSFTDPLPKGSLLIMAGVQVFGTFWCYSSSAISPTITATLGSTTVGTIKLESRGSAQSNCRTTVQCDGGVWTSSSSLYQSGWPKYVYGGVNYLRIDTTYYPRIGSVTLYLSYIASGKLVTTQVNIQE